MDTTLNGAEILEQGKLQAEKFGARFFEMDVMSLNRDEKGRFVLRLELGESLTAWSADSRHGGFPQQAQCPGGKGTAGEGCQLLCGMRCQFLSERVCGRGRQ